MKQTETTNIKLKSMASGKKSIPSVERMLKMLVDPTHVNHIAQYYLKCDLKRAEEIINGLVEHEVLYEPYPEQAPKYYAKKNKL